MTKKVLAIGTYSVEGMDSFDWWQELPNIVDYDTIILDTTRILNFWSLAGRLKHREQNEYLLSNVSQDDERIRSNIQLVKEKLLEMLEFDVTVYALYTPKIVVMYELGPEYSFYGAHTAYATFIKTDDWSPISIDIVSEKGKTIYVKDNSYKEYFKDFKGWEYYFVPDSLDIGELESHYHHRCKVTAGLKVIATNKVDKLLAIEFIPYFHRWAHNEDEDEGGWHSLPEKYGGSLTLLPTIDKYNTEALIEILLQRGKVFEETPPPSWISAIEIPSEVSLKNEIDTQKRQLEAMASKIRELESSLAELQRYKGLLYETGITLQELVKTTLEKLGAGIEPSTVTDEFVINIAGGKALVEVKGNTKSISKRDLGQLITDLGEHLKATDEDIGGILIGNAWRLEPLEARDTHDKPVFSQAVVKIAENRSIGLIPTTDLFKAYCKAIEEPQHKTEILSKIISGKGVIKF